jgi:hypothetical protein
MGLGLARDHWFGIAGFSRSNFSVIDYTNLGTNFGVIFLLYSLRHRVCHCATTYGATVPPSIYRLFLVAQRHRVCHCATMILGPSGLNIRLWEISEEFK